MPAPSIRIAAVPAAWGPILLAATDDAVVAVDFLATADGFRDRVERRLGIAADKAGGTSTVLDRAVHEVETYLLGRLWEFSLPIALGPSPAWDRAVLASVRDIPWGSVTSYGGVARRIGRAGAARAVGGAVGRNPIGLLIPCHRVIAGDGTIGGYGGGWYGTRERLLEIKRSLLELESVKPPPKLRDALADE